MSEGGGISGFFSLFYWRVYKWFVRLVTRKCELLRICQNTNTDFPTKVCNIASSLKYSKHKELTEIVDSSTPDCDVVEPDVAYKRIVKIKKVSNDKYPGIESVLKSYLLPVIALTALRGDVEKMRRQPYSSDNTEHEQLLSKLWALLVPHTELKGRYGNHWGTIGFQGKDPGTDFRGMGILSLHCLVYFAETYNGKALQVLGRSQHPSKGYPLAITSINMTQLLYSLLTEGSLDYYIYYTTEGRVVTLIDFMETYCYIMYSFDQYWFESEPENIMAFTQIKNQFLSTLKGRLRERPLSIQLTIN